MAKDYKWRSTYREVEFSEWKPDWELQQYPDDLWHWINSINDSFAKRKYYNRFERYVMQAHWWINNDKSTIYDYHSREDQLAFIHRERIRCEHNTLYFANKYGWLKEGSVASGKVKFNSFPAQEVTSYLIDSLLSLIIAKGRQIGMTSFLTLAGIKDINIKKNYFLKYVACDVDKSLEIFNDKIKDGFSLFAENSPWFASQAMSDNKKELRTGYKETKGRVKGRNSRILVNGPSKTSINGGSPQKVYIDEIGLIENGSFSSMLNEGRPTLYMYNPESDKLEMVRQVVCWGTGGEMEKGGGQMEVEYKSAMEAWREKDFSHGLIPLFFDWTARPGATKKEYEAEKRFYYRKAEKEKDPAQIVQFHQAWPTSIDDVFMRNTKTLVDRSVIVEQIDEILEMHSEGEIRFGYFEPIYNQAVKYHENFIVPHPIIGARFVETEFLSDPRTTAFIRREPERWKYRYFQGIDPINSETGKSKFSATVWDKVNKEVSSGVFYRERRYQMCYIQALLQKIYYGSELGRGCATLIENNIGDDLMNLWESLGWWVDIVGNLSLPMHLRSRGTGGTTKWWGISNRTHNAGNIIGSLVMMLEQDMAGLKNLWFWHNMKTFVEKEVSSQTHRETRWQAQNKDVDYDDQIFSTTFAYIAADCEFKPPMCLDKTPDNVNRAKMKYVMENGSLVLRMVDKKGRYTIQPNHLIP